jgi:hypothetical protein
MRYQAADIDPVRFELALEIEAERRRQDAQWGGPAHDDEHEPGDWCQYLAHQQRLLLKMTSPTQREDIRARFVKIAALAFAAIESIDRDMRIRR